MSVVEQALRFAQAHPEEMLAIVGPTGTGKTALAVGVAERLGAEIVSADSVQVYRFFDIGSGKPTVAERARARHHLVDALEPFDHADAAFWANAASRALDDVRRRGRIPIVCGGTFLWIKALLYGLAEAPAANRDVRLRHRTLAARQGRPALHVQLGAVDPESAARLHPNDLMRVSRALEVFELTGRPLSVWQKEHAFAQALHPARLVAIEMDPATLTERIRQRVRGWLQNGWIDEVQSLLARGYGEARAMQSVGYAQIRAMLAGAPPREDLETAIVRATRIFARRQRTWLRHADVTWLAASDPSSLGR